MAKTQPVPPSLQSILTPQQFQQYAGKGGRLNAKEAAKAGFAPPPKGYSYTYDFNSPGNELGLKKDSTLGKKIAKGAMLVGGGLATALTGGAASPLLMAAIGAGTGAGMGALDGGWKGALMGAGTGALTGGLAGGGALGGALGGGAAKGGMSAISQAGLGLGKQTAGNIAKSYLTNPQTLAGIGGQVVPGKGGQLLSLAGSGGGNVASPSWLTSILKNPNTYGTLLGIAGGLKGGGGSTTGTIAGPSGSTSPYILNASGTGAGGAAQGNPQVNTAGPAGGGGPYVPGAGMAGIAAAGGAAGTGAAGGMAKEREVENTYGINVNNATTARYGTEQAARINLLQMAEKALLDRAKAGQDSDAARAKQVVRGSLLANMQPASITHPRAHIPKLSGGLTPASLSPQAREAGNLLQTKALGAMQSGSDVPAMPDFMGAGTVKPPAMPEYKGAGAAETALGAAGTGSTMLSGILEALQKQATARYPPINQQAGPVQGPPAPPAPPPQVVGTDTTGWKGWGM